jgi:hypothetical protein
MPAEPPAAIVTGANRGTGHQAARPPAGWVREPW